MVNTAKLAAQENALIELISSLEDTKGQKSIERKLARRLYVGTRFG